MNAHETTTTPLPQIEKRTQAVNIPLKPARDIKAINKYFLWVVFADLMILNACIYGGLLLKIPYEQLAGPLFDGVVLFMAAVNITAFFVASFTEIFRVFEGLKLDLRIRDLFHSALICFGIIGLIYYQFFFEAFQVHFLVSSFLVFMTLAVLLHYGLRILNRNIAGYLIYAVIGGKSKNLNYLEEVLETAFGRRTICLGRFGSNPVSGANHLGGYQDIKHFLWSRNDLNKLIYIDSDLSDQEIKEIVKGCRSQFVDFDFIPQAIDFFERGIQVEQLSQLPIFRRKKEPLCLMRNKILKRTFDIVFSLAVITLVLSWLYPIIAILIKLESPGPVLFKQKRTGYWNRPFNCLKFRSMKVNQESDKKQAMKKDPRITRVGAFLRKTSLDEFPQFINVLKGDMSIVGPRPHMLKHTEDYSKLIDTFMIRHEVRPGITGWAQVNGWRGPTNELYQMAKRVEYDVKYIENWSFWFDCKCILMTVLNIFKGEKNAF